MKEYDVTVVYTIVSISHLNQCYTLHILGDFHGPWRVLMLSFLDSLVHAFYLVDFTHGSQDCVYSTCGTYLLLPAGDEQNLDFS
jgi:hypothetical protein